MPRYRSRSKSRERKARRAARAKVPREKRKLLHWAVKGTKADYERLRKHAHKALMAASCPATSSRWRWRTSATPRGARSRTRCTKAHMGISWS